MGELGRWITNGTKDPFYARGEIAVKKEIASATAKVCGLGQFHFYINGNKVSNHELDPGWTNYDKLIEYVTFDVTKYLTVGKNVLGAEVGNGWFIKNDHHYTFHFPSFMPPNPNPYRPFGKSLVLALSLEIIYLDKTREVITADNTFTVKEHPVTASNVYGSETIDGRRVQKGWCTVGYDDSHWKAAQVLKIDEEPTGRLADQIQPPIQVIKTYHGKLLHTAAGQRVYDFSQNMSGILEAEVKGKAGDVLYFYPGEKLKEDGTVDQEAKNWVTVDSCITYIIGADDTWETCRMVFTYFAGRYVSAAGDAQIRNIRGHAISSAHESAGSFSCDEERFEKIYDMVEKTVEANMVSVHTDCPTIERFAWQEPNHLMAPSIMYMKNMREMWKKILLDMRTDQHKAEDYYWDMEGGRFYPGEGLMPSQCPCYYPNVLPVPGMGSFYDIIPWGSTCILGTYWHYMFYGDISIIKDNYEAGVSYFKHLTTMVTEDGFINHGLGDWGHPKQSLLRENIETVFLYADAMTLAKFAGLLEKEEEKEKFTAYAQEVKANYNRKLLVKHPQKGYYCYRAFDHKDEVFMTQASQALPLYFDMVPKEWEEDVVKAFRDTLEAEDALVSGEIGLPYVIQTARKYGMNDAICRYILKEEHPSYYAFILDNETTLGEYWEKNPRSHCHDMMGHIIEWYYNGIAGILPKEAGFSKIIIKPYMPESMNRFTCSFASVHGVIRVQAERKADHIHLEVSVPPEIEYTIDRTNLK